MKTYFSQITTTIQDELQLIDIDGCNISIEESRKMVQLLKKCLADLRIFFISKEPMDIQEEIGFFKEMKPEVLGFLLYFNKIHNIELKCPTGSNETQREYYESELSSLTFFFEKHLDFYQYYRAKSTYLDEYYFVRGQSSPELCIDSVQFIHDPVFSTGYDYKAAKIICNEMLRIYLNQKMQTIEKQIVISKNRSKFPENDLKWTASKIAAIELGYSLHSSAVFNNGNIDVKEVMSFLEICFNIDLGDYYRAYVTMKNRKKDRTIFLNELIESLIKKMDKDDSE